MKHVDMASSHVLFHGEEKHRSNHSGVSGSISIVTFTGDMRRYCALTRLVAGSDHVGSIHPGPTVMICDAIVDVYRICAMDSDTLKLMLVMTMTPSSIFIYSHAVKKKSGATPSLHFTLYTSDVTTTTIDRMDKVYMPGNCKPRTIMYVCVFDCTF